ncbi:MAG TPA: hypothetical protein VFW94_15100 [Candidatus Acidoferrales bacterium]|nr:hypothetical protein [Candidatus Acidoferrales bacterium]
MPSINDIFGGTTLKAEDIKGKDPTITIENVAAEDFTENGKVKRKLRIFIRGAKKQLICNATNARRIAHLYGEDYSQWGGNAIQLRVEMVDFGGKVTDGIRVYPPAERTARPSASEMKAPAKQAAADDDMNDSIPF